MLFKLLILIMMAAFYICYFAKMISQKKQGIRTDQLGKGKEGFVKFVEVTLKIVTYIIPIIQIISIVLYAGMVHIVVRIIGIAVTGVGVLVFITSVLQMKDNWRAGVQPGNNRNLCCQQKSGIFGI